MTPGPDGLTYDLQTQLANFGQLILPSQPTSNSLALTLECWGRLGAESTPLGTIHSTHGSPDWDGRLLTESVNGISLHYQVNQNPRTVRPINIPLTPGLPGPTLNLPTVFMPLDGGNDATLPPPTAVRDIRLLNQVCNFLAIFHQTPPICSGSQAWHAWDGIAWNWSDPNGRYSEHMLSGFHIKVNQLEMINPHHPILSTLTEFDIHPGSAKSAPAPAILNNIGCSTSVEIYVQAVAGLSLSDYSDPLVYTAPPCTQNDQITITLDQIIIAHGDPNGVTDNDPCVACTDRRLELYGSYLVSRFSGIIMDGPTAHNGPEFGACPDQTECATGGIYRFDATDPHQRLSWNISMPGDGPGIGETLSMLVDLSDYDYFTWLTSFYPGAPLHHYSNDPAAYRWCHASLSLPGRSAVDWERFDQTFHLQDNSPEGTCDIQVHVQGGSH
jgi:hypothetical protein